MLVVVVDDGRLAAVSDVVVSVDLAVNGIAMVVVVVGEVVVVVAVVADVVALFRSEPTADTNKTLIIPDFVSKRIFFEVRLNRHNE